MLHTTLISVVLGLALVKATHALVTQAGLVTVSLARMSMSAKMEPTTATIMLLAPITKVPGRAHVTNSGPGLVKNVLILMSVKLWPHHAPLLMEKAPVSQHVAT